MRAAAAAAMVIAGFVSMAISIDSRPSLIATQDLPGDVSALTDATWTAFVAAFPAQRSCMTDVRLTLVEEISGGAARYLAESSAIEIEIPTSPARYPESLAHELGHHLEETCDVEGEIGDAFRHAQRFSREHPWDGSGEWKERPSEHFSETVVLAVLGNRLSHADLFDISVEAAGIVERWAHATPLGD